MPVENRVLLKTHFELDDKPNQAQFASLIDSFWHKSDDSINWTDIAGKPTLFSGAWTDLTGKPIFATIATTGAYADLTGKPTLFSGTWADLTGKPSTFTPSAHSHAWADITAKPTFATVATSGAYSDLIGIPSTFTPTAHTHTASDIVSGAFSAARLAAGTATDGYIIKSVSGTPTWSVMSSGSGISGLTNNFLPKATSSTTIGNSLIQDDGSNVSVGISLYATGNKLQVGGSIGAKGGTIYDNPGGYGLIAGNSGYFGFIQTYGGTPLNIQGLGTFTKFGDITTPTEVVDVAGNIKANGFKLSALNAAPVSSTASGNTGEIRFTSSYVYLCVATNTWVRAALTTW